VSLPSELLSGPWPARLTWALAPLLVGPALGGGLDTVSRPVALTATVLAWAIWTGVLVATLLPRTASLTALRIAAPLELAAAGWAAVASHADALDALALGWAALTVVAAFSALTGEVFVDGSSYGDERRFPLRVPGPLLLGPLPLAWVAAVAGPVGGPLLLAAEAWVAGALVVVAGVPLALGAIRALHGLARRWVVFVPAGMVLHDPASLADPVLFRRADVAGLGPAPADAVDGALDLTQRALGLALQLEAQQPAEVAPRSPRRGAEVEVASVSRLLFTPTRPGAVMSEAARRRIAVG
jgi:hypothetical protein